MSDSWCSLTPQITGQHCQHHARFHTANQPGVTRGKNPKYWWGTQSVSIRRCVAAELVYHTVKPHCVPAEDRLACVVYRMSSTPLLLLIRPSYIHVGDVSWVSLGFLFHHMLFWVSVSFREMTVLFWGEDGCGVGVLKGPYLASSASLLIHILPFCCEKAQVYFRLASRKTNTYWYIRYWRQWDLMSDVPASAHLLLTSAMMPRVNPTIVFWAVSGPA